MLLRFNGEKKFWGFLESSIVAAIVAADGSYLYYRWRFVVATVVVVVTTC
jgi:hypothetical protein